jgi:hypothetical protein
MMDLAGQERDDALALLEKCRAEYLAIARAKAREIAVKAGRVTVDDVRAACPPPSAVDPRVMGAIFNTPEWQKVGYCNSKRRACHKRPISIFQLA